MNGGLFLICGDDDYLVETAAREKIGGLLPASDREFGLETVDGRAETGDEARRAVDACMESVQTPGFFGTSKVTWLRDARFLTGGARVSESATAKEAVESLVDWLKGGLLDGQALVITTSKVLRSSVFFKVCLKQGQIQDFGGGFKPWEMEKFADERLDGLLSKVGLTMGDEARKEFLNRVGFDTRALVQEVEKLRLYLGGEGMVKIGDVREITSIGREAEAWDLLDAFGERNAFALLETLKRLSGQKGVGVMLAAMLEKTVRELLVLREAYDRKWVFGGKGGGCGWTASLPPDAAVLLNALPVGPKTMNAWALKKKLPHALNYSLQELRVARFRILDLREKLVSTALPEMFLLETTLLRIIGTPARAPKAGAASPAGVR